MDGTASVNSAGRPHCASSIPVPRAASQTSIHAPAASPRLRPHQAGLALSPQRAASPRLGKPGGPSRGSSPKASRGRGSPKPSGAARESAEGAEGLTCSPWSSPRVTPKAALSSRAGCRSAGETQGTQGKKGVAQEGILTRQTRGRSPSRTSSNAEAQIPGAPEGRKPSNHPGKDQRDVPYKSSGGPRSSELDAREASGPRSPVCSPSRQTPPTALNSQADPGLKGISSAPAQTDPEPGPLRQGSWAADGYSGPPSRTEESLSGEAAPLDNQAPACQLHSELVLCLIQHRAAPPNPAALQARGSTGASGLPAYPTPRVGIAEALTESDKLGD
ncbi:hypothetical protein EI555_015413 [Monodon monoceros]|uniref:Uncharacterized protein n=1 Tax=Monodon monoceros TaxID=40151 RepID=A0A4U1EZN8_MONMO|nr:hypothetical protein EI555_015413 [Monodon monoceros]